MAIKTALLNFRKDVRFSLNTITLAHSRTPRGRFIYDQAQRSFITESSYLKIFIAWETFLEQTFSFYLLGRRSIFNRNVVRYIKPRDLNHATQLTIGASNIYFDWSRPDTVINLSKLYFVNGEPFNSTISSINGDLKDMKTIRNAAAHLSSSTSTSLNSLASRLLGIPLTNIKAYDLLNTILPGSVPPIRILDDYVQTLDTAAQAISEA